MEFNEFKKLEIIRYFGNHDDVQLLADLDSSNAKNRIILAYTMPTGTLMNMLNSKYKISPTKNLSDTYSCYDIEGGKLLYVSPIAEEIYEQHPQIILKSIMYTLGQRNASLVQIISDATLGTKFLSDLSTKIKYVVRADMSDKLIKEFFEELKSDQPERLVAISSFHKRNGMEFIKLDLQK